MKSQMVTLSEIDTCIVVALQVNGRASWREIAALLGEQERTVARRGNRLIASGAVHVVALEHERIGTGDPLILRLRCDPTLSPSVGRSLAELPECLWVYSTAGSNEVVAELFCRPERLSKFLFETVAPLPGVTSMSTHPVLHYFRTVDQWQPGLVDRPEIGAIAYSTDVPSPESSGPQIQLDPIDRILVESLKEDGRRTHEELAVLAGISQATASRRVEALRDSSLISIRAVVDPALLGYSVEALLWIKTRPDQIAQVGAELAAVPEVRYAAAIGGSDQIIAQLTVPSRSELYARVTAEKGWTTRVSSIETALLFDVHKRSNIIPA